MEDHIDLRSPYLGICISFPFGELPIVFQEEIYAIVRAERILIEKGITGQEIFSLSDRQAAIYALSNISRSPKLITAFCVNLEAIQSPLC